MLTDKKLLTPNEGKEVLNKVGNSIDFDKRKYLLQQLSKSAEKELRNYGRTASDNKEIPNPSTLFGETVYIPIPQTFGIKWVGVDKKEIEDKRKTFISIVNTFRSEGLISKKETKMIHDELLHNNNYYFNCSFYELCLSKIK